MLGWLLVLIVFLILSIVLRILHIKNDWYFLDNVVSVIEIISWSVVFCAALALPIGFLTTKEKVETFKEYEFLLEEVYNDGAVEDTALNVQVVELNKWLSSSRSKVEVYGIFSFYKDKIDELEYLNLRED